MEIRQIQLLNKSAVSQLKREAPASEIDGVCKQLQTITLSHYVTNHTIKLITQSHYHASTL